MKKKCIYSLDLATAQWCTLLPKVIICHLGAGVHIWCPRVSPFELTWFAGLPWTCYPPSGYVLLCEMLRDDQIGYRPLYSFFPLIHLSLTPSDACCTLRQHPPMDCLRFDSLCPQCWSSMASSLSGAAIGLASLLTVTRLNDEMMRAASYPSSHKHASCQASSPSCGFYDVISKLPLFSLL